MSVSGPHPLVTPVGTPRAQPTRFGKYLLVERLGRGGMAEVWKARMLGPAGFQRTLVVKRILPHLVEDPHLVDMFMSEARLSARLNHANIVQVFELGDVAGEYYLTMEYVRGRDLVSVMRKQLQYGPPDPGLGAYVLRDVCRALGYAHALSDDDGRPLKLIHRDVSPSNVMVAFDGAVKLLDFGIAKALADANDNKTQTGTLKGKFGYMAPEQVEGKPFDHRADLFAAGIVLHESLTGRRLFKGQGDLQTIAMVRECRADPPSLLNPQVPPELDRIVLKAIARDPDARYQSGEELASDLDACVRELKWGPERLRSFLFDRFQDESLDGTGSELALSDAHTSPDPLDRPTLRRGTRLFVLAIAASIALGLGAGGMVLRARRARSIARATASAPSAPRGPVVPSDVRVRVSSTPPGAEVFLEDEAGARGRTPLDLRFPRGEHPLKLVLKLDGYRSDTVEVTPDSDRSYQSNLAEAPRPAPRPAREHTKRVTKKPGPAAKPAPPRDAPNLKRGDVVDPFAR
jgi:serine/threonine protein kinase